MVAECFAASHAFGSASELDASSKACVTALNIDAIWRCDDCLTAVDHCTRKSLRNLAILNELSALRVRSLVKYALRGLANIASPRKTTIPLNRGLTVEAAAWGAASVQE